MYFQVSLGSQGFWKLGLQKYRFFILFFWQFLSVLKAQYLIKFTGCNTHDDLPLPVAPMMAFSPGFMIPLRDRKRNKNTS